MVKDSGRHILVFEPRIEGHHLTWLRYIVEDLLSAGHTLTLAIAYTDHTRGLYKAQLEDILEQTTIISVYDAGQKLRGGTKINALGHCMNDCGAEHVFCSNLDDIGSSMLRRSAIGILPPKILKGRLSGVYFRPRFLARPTWPPGNLIKLIGFRRLLRRGWFFRICLVEEYLYQKHVNTFSKDGMVLLPDPWSGDFSRDRNHARNSLGIDKDSFVFLQYGIGTRRKGLHLVIRAMLSKDLPQQWHLLCAGQIKKDKEILDGISRLQAAGRATVLNRYVSKEEEQLCFTAADIVLMPYVRHFGSSGILSLAAAAGKMVIVSDEGLIARRVKENKLGICFPSGDINGLKEAMSRAKKLLEERPHQIEEHARLFAARYDRQAFRKVLTSIYADPAG
ncbi:MAG: glycosyltransferase [Deltaproteobacteria bacterium]|nr:glycosyltransferase [Deltaproteobacteria bacterium]